MANLNLRATLRTYRLYLIVLLIVLDLILAWILISRPIKPSFLPDNVFISNLSQDQATISWVTKRPTESKVLLSTSDQFPILPIFSTQYKDDKDLVIARTLPSPFGERKDQGDKRGVYSIHHVTVKNLLPNRTYRLGIYLGFKKLRQVKFTTAKASLEGRDDDLINGKVVSADGQSGLEGVNVYYRAQTATSSSNLLSTITSSEGGWRLDLSNLSSNDLREHFPIKDGVKQQLIVEAGPLGGYELSTKSASLRVWPTITVLRKE